MTSRASISISGVLFAIVAFTSGCETAVQQSAKKEEGSYSTVPEKLVLEDVRPVFDKIFGANTPLTRDKLETQDEYRGRMKALGAGIVGSAVTCLVEPAQCEIDPELESGFFVVHTRASWLPGSYGTFDPASFGIPVRTEYGPERKYTATNAFGATVAVTEYTGKRYRLRPTNKPHLFAVMWKENTGELRHYGVGMFTGEADIRAAMRANKVGLVFRGIVASPELAARDFDYRKATITDPTEWTFDLYDLPVEITDIWVVNVDTMTSYVRWSLNALPGGTPVPNAPTVGSAPIPRRKA